MSLLSKLRFSSLNKWH